MSLSERSRRKPDLDTGSFQLVLKFLSESGADAALNSEPLFETCFRTCDLNAKLGTQMPCLWLLLRKPGVP
jgi:hypothetical protein